MRNRWQKTALQEQHQRRHGRLIALTGARQTGKTTLAREAFPDTQYISLEDPILRPSFTRLRAIDWIQRFPNAILDEVQKAPTLFESIKAAYDQSPDVRYILLGSSQFRFMPRLRESLAGRIAIRELWPLTLPELATHSWEQSIQPSRLIRMLQEDPTDPSPLSGIPLTDQGFTDVEERLERYLEIGGMPFLHQDGLTEGERWQWLHDYQRTYLERDVADLTNLRNLEPFSLALQAMATQIGRPANYSDLARMACISVDTAKRFMRYMEISYMVLLIQPWFRNPQKRLSKMPRVAFVDPGIYRQLANRRGSPTGEELEAFVTTEIYKQLCNANLPVRCYHLRTYDGREVDLLLELDRGFIGIEIKSTHNVSQKDARHLRNLETLMDRPVLQKLVLSRDPEVRWLSEDVLAVPIAWALG